MSIFAKAQNSWVGKFIKAIFKVEIIHPENEPRGQDFGGFIVCVNHSSNWDPIIIGACMHRPLRYMAKAELFKIPGLKTLITWFGAYPVNRERADISSIKTTISILEQGEVVGMYMQGGRKRGVHPKDITPKNGAAMIAVKARTGVLPVSVIAKKHKVQMFRRTIIVFGKYMTYDELTGSPDNPDMRERQEPEQGVGGGANPRIKENMDLYKKATEKIYSEIVSNYDKYDTFNKK